jgi:hypothetical protein
VEDLTGTDLSSNPRDITQVGDRIFLRADTVFLGGEVWSGTLGSRQGDFDRNGLLETADIDALVAAIAGGEHPLPFDVNNDTLVNGQDLNRWLQLGGAANLPSGNPYRPGDANLDGAVDGSDFGIWNANKFTFVAAWSLGDFNADGQVDGSDFGIWNSNKFTASAGTGRVTEADFLAVSPFSAVNIGEAEKRQYTSNIKKRPRQVELFFALLDANKARS